MTNYTKVDQETLSLEKMVSQLNDLEIKMEDVNERYKKLREIEEINQPICERFSGEEYESFKSSGVISIETIREFRTAREKLKEIEEEKSKLSEEAKKINEERSVLESQISKSYGEIVDLIESKEVEENNQKYVPGLDGYFDIIDKSASDYKDNVDDIASKIINANASIIETIADSYKKNVTKVVHKPVNEFAEIDTLVESLNESKRLKEEKIDSQISLVDNGVMSNDEEISENAENQIDSNEITSQEQKIVELISEPTIDNNVQSLESSILEPNVINVIPFESLQQNTVENIVEPQTISNVPLDEVVQEQKPVELVSEPIIDSSVQQNAVASNNITEPQTVSNMPSQEQNNVINLDTIMNNNEQSNIIDYRIFNIFDRVDQDIDKVANSNSEKCTNIQNNIMKAYDRGQNPESNFTLSTKIKVVNSVLENTVQDSNLNEQNNVPTLEPANDPIANFLNANKTA